MKRMVAGRQHDDARLAETADRVLAALRNAGAYGRERAVRQAEIARAAGCSSRVLQAACLVLVDRGVPIASTCAQPCGMFLADTLTELQAYRDQLHARIVGNAVRMKAINQIRRAWIERLAVEPDWQRRLFA